MLTAITTQRSRITPPPILIPKRELFGPSLPTTPAAQYGNEAAADELVVAADEVMVTIDEVVDAAGEVVVTADTVVDPVTETLLADPLDPINVDEPADPPVEAVAMLLAPTTTQTATY